MVRPTAWFIILTTKKGIASLSGTQMRMLDWLSGLAVRQNTETCRLGDGLLGGSVADFWVFITLMINTLWCSMNSNTEAWAGLKAGGRFRFIANRLNYSLRCKTIKGVMACALFKALPKYEEPTKNTSHSSGQ